MAFLSQLQDSDDDFLLRLRERSGLGLLGGGGCGDASTSSLIGSEKLAGVGSEDYDWSWSSRVIDKARSALQDWRSDGEDDSGGTHGLDTWRAPLSHACVKDDNDDTVDSVEYSHASLTLSHSTAAASSPRSRQPQLDIHGGTHPVEVDSRDDTSVASSASSILPQPSRWQQLRGQAFEALAGERDGLKLTAPLPSTASRQRRTRPSPSPVRATNRTASSRTSASSQQSPTRQRNAIRDQLPHDPRNTIKHVPTNAGTTRQRTVQPQLLELKVDTTDNTKAVATNRRSANSPASEGLLGRFPAAIRSVSPNRRQLHGRTTFDSVGAAPIGMQSGIQAVGSENNRTGVARASVLCVSKESRGKIVGGSEQAEELNFRRLRGSSTRVYYFGDGPPAPRRVAEHSTSAPSQSPGVGVTDSDVESEGGEDEGWESVQRAMGAWRAAVASRIAETSKMVRWLEWRRHLRCWKAWRHVVVVEAAERAAQNLFVERKKTDIASRFHRLWVLHRAVAAWRAATELTRAAKAQAAKEEAERVAYEADMERIRKMYAAKVEVADRFSCTYLCHRAVAAWQRGVRTSKQEAAVGAQRAAARSRIQAVIAAKKAKASTFSDPERSPPTMPGDESLSQPSTDCFSTTDETTRKNEIRHRSVVVLPTSTVSSPEETTRGRDESLRTPSTELQSTTLVASGDYRATSVVTQGSCGKSAARQSGEERRGLSSRYNDVNVLECVGRHLDGEAVAVELVTTSDATCRGEVEGCEERGRGDSDASGSGEAVSGGEGKGSHGAGVSGMEARAKERAHRRAALASKYEQQRRLAEAEEVARVAAEEAEREGDRERQRQVALSRRAEAKKAAEARNAVQRLAEQQSYLAGMHYSLTLLRRLGWRPWRHVMDGVKLQRWRASECHRRRMLSTAVAAWWSPVEASLAAQWRMTVVAERFCHVHSTGRVFLAWLQWCAAVRAGDRGIMSRGFAAFKLEAWVTRQLERRRVEFRWEWLAGYHFRAWQSVWRNLLHVKLIAESKMEALAWEHAALAMRVRCLSAWKIAVAEGKAERGREERRAEAWSKINGWLDCGLTKQVGRDDDSSALTVESGPIHIEGILSGGRSRENNGALNSSSALLRRQSASTKSRETTKTASTAVCSTERREMVARLMRAAAATPTDTVDSTSSGNRGRNGTSINDFLAVLPPPPTRQL